MLCQHIAALVNQCIGSRLLVIRRKPGVRHCHQHLRIRIDFLDAHCKCINTTGTLTVVAAHRRYIPDQITFRLHTRYQTGQISRLIDSSEIVCKIASIAHISGSVCKINIRIFLRICRGLFHVTPARCKYNVAAFVHTFIQCFFDRHIIAIVYRFLAYNLIFLKSEI